MVAKNSGTAGSSLASGRTSQRCGLRALGSTGPQGTRSDAVTQMRFPPRPPARPGPRDPPSPVIPRPVRSNSLHRVAATVAPTRPTVTRSRDSDRPGTTAPSMQCAHGGTGRHRRFRHAPASPPEFEHQSHGAPRSLADWPGRGEVRGSKSAAERARPAGARRRLRRAAGG